MADKSLKQMMCEATRPHLARAMREVKGYPEGTLTCKMCGAKNANHNRQRTAYVNDDMNWADLCPECQKEADEYWDEMWSDYYSMVM